MTNKINSIDVSECVYYEPKAQKMTCHEEAITKPCENTPICYYKLLQKSYIEIQRLQEENEGLKSLNDFNVQKIEVLQKENEELKKIFKKIDKLLDEALDAEVTDMEQSLDRLYTISEMIGKVLNDRD